MILTIFAAFLGFIGIISLAPFVFFNVGTPPPPTALFQTCLSAPSSEGCEACRLGGEYVDLSPEEQSLVGPLPPNAKEAADLCSQCEDEYRIIAGSGGTMADVSDECRDPGINY